MENRSHALIAGFFTIALLALTAIFAYWLGRDNIQRKPYDIVTRLSVGGLNPQAAVRYKGIKVGNVTGIDFDAQHPGEIVIRIEVLPDTPVTRSTFARLGTQGVTGIASVELEEDGTPSSTVLASVKGIDKVPQIPLMPSLLQTIQERGLAIIDQTEIITKRINVLLDPERPNSVPAALEHIGKAAVAWQQVPEKLAPTFARLPELTDASRDAVKTFKNFSSNATTTAKNWTALATNLQSPDGAVAKVSGAVEQISDALTNQTVPSINALSADARLTLRSVGRTSESLKDRPQSILFGAPAPAPGPGEAGFVAPR